MENVEKMLACAVHFRPQHTLGVQLSDGQNVTQSNAFDSQITNAICSLYWICFFSSVFYVNRMWLSTKQTPPHLKSIIVLPAIGFDQSAFESNGQLKMKTLKNVALNERRREKMHGKKNLELSGSQQVSNECPWPKLDQLLTRTKNEIKENQFKYME